MQPRERRGESVERVIATKTKTEAIICPHSYTNGEKRWLGIRLTDVKDEQDALFRVELFLYLCVAA